MKKGYIKIAIVLDRSGSMEVVKKATIDGINEFVNQQKSCPFGECGLRIAQFDHEYGVIYDGALASAPIFGDDTYVPRGMTALYDAIGRTVDELGAELDKLPEDQRPEKVIVAIITDGYENASHLYTRPKIAETIKRQRETYKWEFVFIGANQDAILTAETFNIPPTSALSYNQSERGVRNSMRAFAAYAGSVADPTRVAGSGTVAFTRQDRDNAMQ